MDCICNECGREYMYERSKGHTYFRCNTCVQRVLRLKRRQQAVTYLGGKCTKCGYNKSITALSCHHQDRELKEFPISGNHTRAWTAFKAELDKCILLCHNCHMELEYGVVPPDFSFLPK